MPADFDKSKLLMSADDRIERLSVEVLQPNPFQPRKHFDESALAELADSITQYGIVQPLIVTPAGAGRYSLIAGERRWRAARLAGLAQVPAIVRTSRELEQLEVALLENVQRVDLSPLEQAATFERWHEEFSVSYDVIAKRIGKGLSTVTNIVRLLQLPPAARDALATGDISEGHARTILSLKDSPSQQQYLLDSIKRHGWSVRQAERYVTSIKDGAGAAEKAHDRVNLENPVTKALSVRIGAPVAIRRTARGGRLEITFRTDEELDRLVGLFPAP